LTRKKGLSTPDYAKRLISLGISRFIIFFKANVNYQLKNKVTVIFTISLALSIVYNSKPQFIIILKGHSYVSTPLA